MKSNFNQLFYIDINQAIFSWERLLTCLQSDLNFKTESKADADDAVKEVKELTFKAFNSKESVFDVENVSDLYAKNIANAITQVLSKLYPNIKAELEVNDKQKTFLKFTCSQYDSKGEFIHAHHQRLDTYSDFMNMISFVSNYDEYYGILDEIQRRSTTDDTLIEDDDTENLFLVELKNSVVEDIIEKYSPTEEEFISILGTQDFYVAFGDNKDDCPSEVVKAIASALAVKAMVQEQLDIRNATDVKLSVEMNGLQAELVAQKQGEDAFEIYILDIDDIGEIINKVEESN